MRHIKKHVFVDKLYSKSSRIAEECDIKIDEKLYNYLRSRLSKSTMIDLLDEKEANDVRIRALLMDYVNERSMNKFRQVMYQMRKNSTTESCQSLFDKLFSKKYKNQNKLIVVYV